jgi:hypothetical protein
LDAREKVEVNVVTTTTEVDTQTRKNGSGISEAHDASHGAAPARLRSATTRYEPWPEALPDLGAATYRVLERLVGAIVIAAPMAPVLAFILSVLAMGSGIGFATDGQPALVQVAIGNLVLAWLVLAIAAVVLGLSTARGALPASYAELAQWLVEVKVWVELLRPLESKLPSLNARTAYGQLCNQYQEIQRDLKENGAKWFLGTGYVNVWWRVHQAQEALVRVVSTDTLQTYARVELLRVQGSGIASEDDGVGQLSNALTVLNGQDLASRVWVLHAALIGLADALDRHDQAAVVFTRTDIGRSAQEVIEVATAARTVYEAAELNVLQTAVTDLATSDDVQRGSDGAAVRTIADALQARLDALQRLPLTTTPASEQQARDVVYAMRMKVDNYRDKARSGLARGRADLTRTLTLTAMLAYFLFWVVIEASVISILSRPNLGDEPPQILFAPVIQTATGALGLFLWGALVSLFAQLYTKSTTPQRTGEDDLGLGVSQTMVVPVLAGIAGLCGVVIGTFGGELLKGGLSGLSNQADATTLAAAFLPGTSPVSLLYAAIFALSPGALIARLSTAANFQQSLSNTSVGDGGTSSGEAKK